ncbi:MAG: cation-transporting P-type ATPase [Nitrospiraceae bacterium]|nr:cation-transporting P-type ATPase [Nitrospiraceae bacterium]
MPVHTFIEPVHAALKGRTRFRIKGLYRSEPMKRFIEAKLPGRGGVSRVYPNPLTSKVLVFYNSGNTPSHIASLLEGIVSEYNSLERKGRRAVSRSPQKLVSTRLVSTRLVSTKRKVRRLAGRAGPQRRMPWHLMEASEAVGALETSAAEGLSADSALARLKEYGPNLLPESVPRSGLAIFLGQLNSLPVLLLGAAAAISVATGGLADAVVIMSVVGINAAIGYVTESQSEKTIFSLKKFVRPSALVRRDGVIQRVKAEELVPGDIVAFRPGSYVPADCRLITAGNLSVDESTLTGESMPAVKNPARLHDGRIPLADRLNMGTLVTGGQAAAVVVATGGITELGGIEELIGETVSPRTPMEMQLDRMGDQLVYVSLAVCGLVFIAGLLRGYGLLRMLTTSISLAVAAVPEGLPAVATTTLALGIRDMRRHRIIVRQLEAIDTLGSVRTVCLDKTGTITMNRMSAVTVHVPGRELIVSDGLFYEKGGPVNLYENEDLLKLVHVSVLCNETEIAGEDGKYVLNGTPTENALVQMALSSGVDAAGLRRRFPLRKAEYRSESRNFMCTYHDFPFGRTLAAMKGSPVEVLAMCGSRYEGGRMRPLTDDDREAILTDNERMAAMALRVLGVAYRISGGPDNGRDNTGQDGFIWLGIVGMADPVRKGVKGLIGVFHGAGIDTVMITGDQSPTAYAIGKELGLGRDGGLEILDSTHLIDLDPEVMKALAQKVNVFSRVSPAHKLQIVQALQGAGRVVAMTGDGINDGPALKAADIGIAMGTAGTDVAREIADIIIEDDNLETLVVAVSRGRTIYNNIRKSVHFLLATNLSEITVMLTATAAGLGQPLNATQLLWINLISDIFPGLALALEPPEPDVLTRPPRSRDEQILKGSDFKRLAFESAALSAGSLAAYGYGVARYGIGPRAGTLAFTSLTAGQLLHAISCRSEKTGIFSGVRRPPNRYLRGALAGSFVLQFAAMLLPGMRGLLGLAPLGALDIGVAGMGAVAPLLVNEASKNRQMRIRGSKQ